MNRNLIVIAFLSFLTLSCADDDIKKADLVPGYWQALRETSVFINGMYDGETTRGYYYEFYDNNCGQLFDQDQNPTNQFKWAFQERDTIDLLLISTALTTSDGSSSDLHTNLLYEVAKIEEMNMKTFRENHKIINGDEYSYNHFTYFVKQR